MLTLAVGVAGPRAGLDIDGRELAVIGASLTTALTCALAWMCVVLHRVKGDPRSLYIAMAAVSLAVFPLALGTVIPSLLDSPLVHDLRAVFALAAVPALVGIGLASRSLEAAASHRPYKVVLGMATGTVAIVVAGGVLTLVPTIGMSTAGVPLPLAGPVTSPLIAAGFGAIVVAHLVAARRRSGQILSWPALAAGGIGGAYAISATGDATTHGFAWLLIACAAAVGLFGAATQLQRHLAADRRRAFAAVIEAFEATANAQGVLDDHAERRHEAHGALLGIEAAAQSLARHRASLSPDQFDELSAGLVAEVHRLRLLIDGEAAPRTSFDLGQTVRPVVSCLRADGLDVRATIPPGITIDGIPENTAQVLVSLLTNAKRHAPGSAIEVWAEVEGEHVIVHVDDRGPGVPASLRERVFQRGAQARPGSGEGSGLGLFITRRLMEQQDASIRLQERPDGGSSFVLRFPVGAAA